jgi:hypothetical protein
MKLAYQAKKTTVSELHHLVRKIENALTYKEVAMSEYIEVEGALDNTGFYSITAAAARKHFEPETVDWIIKMFECRIVRSRLG